MRGLLLLLWSLLGAFAVPFAAADEGVSATDPLPGSMFTRDPIEAAPPDFVLDKARLFSEAERSQLSARLQAFRSAHDGVTVYVVAYSVLIGESIHERAVRLKDAWLADQRGVVLAYQRGTERMTFSSTADPENYVRRSELEHLFANAYARAAEQSRGSSRVIAAAEQLIADLPGAIETQRESNVATKSETNSFVAWALAGLSLLTIAGMFVFHFLRQGQVVVTTSYKLPTIRVAERLGAGYSGGHHAEMRFNVPTK